MYITCILSWIARDTVSRYYCNTNGDMMPIARMVMRMLPLDPRSFDMIMTYAIVQPPWMHYGRHPWDGIDGLYSWGLVICSLEHSLNSMWIHCIRANSCVNLSFYPVLLIRLQDVRMRHSAHPIERLETGLRTSCYQWLWTIMWVLKLNWYGQTATFGSKKSMGLLLEDLRMIWPCQWPHGWNNEVVDGSTWILT